MIVKQATYEVCRQCDSRKRLTDEVYGCDECKAPIDDDPDGVYHRLTLFCENENPDFTFCSVGCTVKWLSNYKPAKDFRFASLPLFAGEQFVEFQQVLRKATKKKRRK